MSIQELYNQLLEQAVEDYRRCEFLPMAVYVTAAEDGVILQANEPAMKLLALTQNDIGTKRIIDFYAYKEDRDYVIARMKRTSPGEWDKNQTLEFKIGGQRKSLRFFAKPFFNRDTNVLLGCVCLVFEITELERFREMQEMMPVGIFEVDRERKVSYANKEFEAMMELPQGTEAEGREARSFFQSEREFEGIIEGLQNNPHTKIENHKVLLKTCKGGLLIARLHVLPTYSESGKLIKSKGMVTDITFSNLLEQAPIGLYRISPNDAGEDIIAWANQDFAKIHDCEKPEQVIGQPISTFYPYPEDKEKFMRKLHEANAQGMILKDYFQEAHMMNGHTKQFIINAKIIKDVENRPIGRIGAVYDITEDINKILSGKQQDYASWLHSYSTMLISLQQTLQAIIGGHGADVVENNRVNIDKSLENIRSNISGLNTALEIGKWNVSGTIREAIVQLISRMSHKDDSSNKEQAAWIRASARKLRDYLKQKGLYDNNSRGIERQVSENITQILRFARIISLQLMIDEIKDALFEIETFKAAVTESDTTKDYSQEVNISHEIDAVVQALSEFSQLRNVEVRIMLPDEEPLVKGNSRDVYNALYNIIHNAIKYSFIKPGEKISWITIQVVSDNSDWRIVVENRGISIRLEEIVRKLIFKFGYRGADSSDRKRQGSGIGLWHSRKIIIAHKGRIDIDSLPIGGADTGEKNLPWITKLRIYLPKLIK